MWCFDSSHEGVSGLKNVVVMYPMNGNAAQIIAFTSHVQKNARKCVIKMPNEILNVIEARKNPRYFGSVISLMYNGPAGLNTPALEKKRACNRKKLVSI